MKIRKSTIVWFILTVLLFGNIFYNDDSSESSAWERATLTRKDAVYVKDVKGKWRIVTTTIQSQKDKD